MTTHDQDHALRHGRRGSELRLRNVMSVRIMRQDHDGDDRAEHAAAAAGQAHAAEDDGGDAGQRVAARAAGPDARAGDDRAARPSAAKSPPSA